MERLWSPAVATGGNRWQIERPRKRLKQAKTVAERPFQLLIHDRDTKFSCAFDEVFRSEGIEVIGTPVRAPNANAFAERWVRTVRNECVDRILILGRRHLERVHRVYRKHYNEHRPHRALRLTPPNGADTHIAEDTSNAPIVHRHNLLGGLIHEYQRAA